MDVMNAVGESPFLLDVNQVAELLGNVSTRHVYRLADGGKMPRPIKLGQLNRWNRLGLLDWINSGCPAVRHVAAKN